MPIAAPFLLLFLAARAFGAETNDFDRQMIALPAHVSTARFTDLGNGGRLDLLAVDPVEKTLLIYRQRAWGFTNAPDQVLPLPPQTGWIAPCDVEAHPGLELLLSTATGLVYYRQKGGVFESDRRVLVQADQEVFTNAQSPSLRSFPANASIPVISSSQVVLYRRNKAFAWSHGPPLPLETQQTSWRAHPAGWTLGSNPSQSLYIQQSFGTGPTDADSQTPENDTLRKLLEKMKRAGPGHQPDQSRVDVNGDGRKDLVLWQVVGDIDPRTDVYLFVRGTDGKLPERPTQVLHCRGIPIPVGSAYQASPVGDLKGDHSYELVLLELKSTFTSVSSLVEMALSRGLEWTCTIRSFHQGTFSRLPDATVPITTIIPVVALEQWPFLICGDFNGDGRPDFILRRSNSDWWSILLSTQDRRFFAPQPALRFEAPMQGYFETEDLNGDGRSDIVLRAWEDPRIFVFLTRSCSTKGNRP